jgi:hypothetical protein
LYIERMPRGAEQQHAGGECVLAVMKQANAALCPTFRH